MAGGAATSSPNPFVVPTPILRCLRLPSGPGSRHLNSQTSGPPYRSVRIMLPFCMDFPFCACNAEIAEEDLQAQIRHRLSMRNGKNRNESSKIIAFPAEITWRVNFSPNAKTKTHLIDPFGHLREDQQVNNFWRVYTGALPNIRRIQIS